MKTELSVAIVDDYPRWRASLKHYLIQEGFSIHCLASNGKELLTHLEQATSLPTFCILDIHMPEMDGYETAKRMKDIYPSVKILGFSLSVGKTIVDKLLECGAHGFIAKGTAPQVIAETLRKLKEKEPQTQP